MVKLFTSTIAFIVFASQANAECTCRFVGGDVKQGETACIVTAKGPVVARCEKVSNVTSWKFLDTVCTPQKVSNLGPDTSKKSHGFLRGLFLKS